MGAYSNLQIEDEYLRSLTSGELRNFWFEEKFEKLYRERKYAKLNFQGLKLISNTKLKLSQELVKVLLGKKIAVEILAILKALGGVKKWISLTKLFKYGLKKSSVYSVVKFLIENGLILYCNQMLKLAPRIVDSRSKKTLMISGKKCWFIFLLYGLSVVKIFRILNWKAKAEKLAKKDAICNYHNRLYKRECGCGKKVIIQNKYFAGENRHFIYSCFKKLTYIFDKEMKDVFKTVKSWKWFANGRNYYFDARGKFCFEFKSERYLLLNIF